MKSTLIEFLTTDIECDKDGHGDCSVCEYKYADDDCVQHIATLTADYLLSNGVVVQKPGHWEWHTELHGNPFDGMDEDFGYRCSECHVWAGVYGVDDDIFEEPPTHILHYCPNCGAKMDGGEE